jgi:hypothetical protein
MGHIPPPGHISRGLITQAAMGALFIILLPILLDDDPCLAATETSLHVQVLIAEFPNETLRGTILPRLARLDKCRADPMCR